MQCEIIHGDRRAHHRYRVDLELSYRLSAANGGTETGSATALEMSRGGVLLEADGPLPLGRAVDIVIPWPIPLQGVCALDLLIRGTTVRAAGRRRTAIQTASYQFKTRGRQSFFQEDAAARTTLAIG